ncbi:MAG: hypothetical protein QOE83_1130 [Actinomycetota bacterium]|nr:hypothetical protein [Actinomycetota bacterium]
MFERTRGKVQPLLLPGEVVEEAVAGIAGAHPMMGLLAGILINGVLDYSSYRNTGHSGESLTLLVCICVCYAAIFPFCKLGIVAVTSSRIIFARTNLRGRATRIGFEASRGSAVMSLRSATVVLFQRVLVIKASDGHGIRCYVPRDDRAARIMSIGSIPPPPTL